MDAQMEILLQIQDLKAQKGDLEAGETAREVQEEQFNLDVDTAVAAIEEKIGDLEADLNPEVRTRYGRLSSAMTRAVVPAINGVCYGCFVSVPTAVASDPDEQKLSACDHCGRFLYFVG